MNHPVKLFENENGIFRVKITNDKNILTTEIIEGLNRSMEIIKKNSNAKVILLEGNDNIFLSDLDEESEIKTDEILSKILESPAPVISVIKGNSRGNGYLAGLLGDIVIISEESKYSNDFILKKGKKYRMILNKKYGIDFLKIKKDYTGQELKTTNKSINILSKKDIDKYAMSMANQIASGELPAIGELKKHLHHMLMNETDSKSTIENKEWLEFAEKADDKGILTEIESIKFREVKIKSDVMKLKASKNGILSVIMCDQESKNTFSEKFIKGLIEVFEHIKNNNDYRVVILTGYDNYFACGGTKEELLGIQKGEDRIIGGKFFSLALDCKIPVIAAMQGHGIGAGWALGMFCDLTIFSEESIYTANFMEYGFTPGAGATMIFPEKFGYNLGQEILFTSKQYRGSELKDRRIGFPVLQRNEVIKRALEFANKLCIYSRAELIEKKDGINMELRERFDDTIEKELVMHEKTFVGNIEVLKRIERNFNEGIEKTSNERNKKIRYENKTVQDIETNDQDILDKIKIKTGKILSAELHLKEIDEDEKFIDMGMDSITGVTFVKKINTEYGLDISATQIYNHPTLLDLSGYILEEGRKKGLFQPERKMEVMHTIENFETNDEDILGKIKDKTGKILSAELHLKEIDEDEKFIDMGMDSITGVTFVKKINTEYGLDISATQIYNHPTLLDLSGFILEEGRKRGLFPPEWKSNDKQILKEKVDREITEPGTNKNLSLRTIRKNRFRFGIWERTEEQEKLRGNNPNVKKQYKADIAIIGMSGKFPMAKDTIEFWENLKSGRDCIMEIPKERWDVSRYYNADESAEGKSYCKYQGIVEDAADFDPLFFNISPIEAETMDPQQRMFLESAWSCIEDAGYNPQSLSGSKCGVYVGCGTGDYNQLMGNRNLDAHDLMGKATSILSSRIAYILNLRGPCLAIDTACSSALVALSEACSSLVSGEIDAAITGGVCVLAGPSMHIMTSKAGMLSKDGHCYTFDNRANGFVPGEGSGAIYLKRLEDAERDYDHIYGIIKGWGVNQDGKTNGITAPNGEAQTRLESEVYEKYKINPESISMVEAHGTGTKLGDPIEVEALVKAFNKFTKRENYCALGSVKSNIGHLFTAAGISGVIKVLLALKNKKIPATVNYEKLNEHIKIEGTPFYVNTKLKEWKTEEGEKRRAAISSFGFSGTNSHIVIEEYVPKNRESLHAATNLWNPEIILLSAKNGERLTEYASRLLSFLEINENSFSYSLSEIAYTLQAGREAMEERIAMIVTSIDELREKLKEYIAGKEGFEKFYKGRIQQKEALSVFTADEELQKAVDSWIKKGKYGKLLDLWVKGLEFDWDRLYGGEKPKRVSLPTYPFARERYWIEENEGENGIEGAGVRKLHPLVHENTSDLNEQRFSSIFTGDEFFLRDHVIRGRRVLPGAAYIEMAREAIERGAGGTSEGMSVILKDMVWAQPMIAGEEPQKAHIGMIPEENGEISFEIYGDGENGGEIVYSQGRAEIVTRHETPALDIQAIRNECNVKIISSVECYRMFGVLGIEYGPGHRGISEIYAGRGKVLARLIMPGGAKGTMEGYALHPGMIDSALQASIGLAGEGREAKPALPFAMEEVDIFGQTSGEMWAYVREGGLDKEGSGINKIDIDVCDDAGKVVVRIKGAVSREITGEEPPVIGTLRFQPEWEEREIEAGDREADISRHIVMLCEPGRERKEERIEGSECYVLEGLGEGIEKRYERYGIEVFKILREVIISKPKGRVLIQLVVNNDEDGRIISGISGALKTGELENPKISGQVIGIEADESAGGLAEKLKSNKKRYYDKEIRYEGGKRKVRQWEEVKIPEDAAEQLPWKDNGVYLVTGGLGGLGLIFAREICGKVKNPALILTGRSKLNKEKMEAIKALSEAGGRVSYREADVTDKEAVEGMIKGIAGEYGGINGIIHSAGVIEDSLIMKKTEDEIGSVLGPKVRGLVNIDEAAKDMELDFFALFSSMAGVMGNVGQADYAIANGFMDRYAERRNMLAGKKERKGKTVSINWPLWAEGGMKVSPGEEKFMRQNSGMTAMPASEGIKAFYQSLAGDRDQVMVINGYEDKLREKLLAAACSNSGA